MIDPRSHLAVDSSKAHKSGQGNPMFSLNGMINSKNFKVFTEKSSHTAYLEQRDEFLKLKDLNDLIVYLSLMFPQSTVKHLARICRQPIDAKKSIMDIIKQTKQSIIKEQFSALYFDPEAFD